MTTRRNLLVALGAAALTAPLSGLAQQQGKVWRIGFLTQGTRPDSLEDVHGEFLRGVRELGYIDGRNLVVEWRFADARSERLPVLAMELVQLKVDVIVASGTQATSAAQKATATIPIVMVGISDPMGSGFVRSLAQPGGNITGLSNLVGDFAPKHLEMLLSIAPRLSRVAVWVHPANSAHAGILKRVQAEAQKRKVKILPVEVRSAQEIENAFSLMIRENVEAVIVTNDTLYTVQRHQIAGLAAKARLPSVATRSDYAEAGGLMSYGHDSAGQWRRAAFYVDRILQGANPGNLPVEQPTKFELLINRRTAKALGLTIPQTLLVGADRVIE